MIQFLYLLYVILSWFSTLYILHDIILVKEKAE